MRTAMRMMSVVERPPLPPPLSLEPPSVVRVEEVMGMPLTVVPPWMMLLRLFWALMAPWDPGALGEVMAMLRVTDPLTMLRTVISLMLTPAAEAIWFIKLR